MIAALRDKQFRKAVDLAKEALKQSPNDARLLTLEGLAFKELHENKEALEAFHAALRIAPDYLAALEGAAQIEAAIDHAENWPSVAALTDLCRRYSRS